MTVIETEVRVAIRALLDLADQEAINADRFPVDMLVGALIFVSDDLKKYTFGDVKNIILDIRGPVSIKWAQNTETGYNREDAAAMMIEEDDE